MPTDPLDPGAGAASDPLNPVSDGGQATSTAANIALKGEDTLLNGETIRGIWSDLGAASIQTYLHENEWGIPAYKIEFPADVLEAPYSLMNGTEMVRVATGARALVRRVSPQVSENAIYQVNALVILATE